MFAVCTRIAVWRLLLGVVLARTENLGMVYGRSPVARKHVYIDRDAQRDGNTKAAGEHYEFDAGVDI